MKRTIMVSILTLVMLVAFGLVGTQAGAEDFKFKITNYLTKVEFIPVGDAKGHIVGYYERRGLVLFENGDVASMLSRGIFDWTAGNGPVYYYNKVTFKDGSTTWAKAHATGTRAPGEGPTFIKANFEYVEGTGRFKGIKGSYS